MIALKCKMCGGDLSVSPGASVGTCQYCGTTMTLPVTGSTQVADQFNRASGLRQGDEFDRASEVYLRLLEANPRDAEAHWGMVLCRFGIAYVEDPETGRRLPTCNRVRFGSILEDEDYLQAITWADGEAKAVYQAEAEAIAAIQREFLDISAREEPFDVFLCYKEKDGQGERTPALLRAHRKGLPGLFLPPHPGGQAGHLLRALYFRRPPERQGHGGGDHAGRVRQRAMGQK